MASFDATAETEGNIDNIRLQRQHLLLAGHGTNQTHCALLSLPAELRNLVYELVIIRTPPIMATKKHGKPSRGVKQWDEPALLRVCHQIRNEANPIFYSRKIFRFHCRDMHTRPLAILLHAEHLKRLQVELTISSYIKINLKSGLQHYKIEFFEKWANNPVFLAPTKLLASELRQKELACDLIQAAVARGEQTLSRRLLQDLLNVFRVTQARPKYETTDFGSKY